MQKEGPNWVNVGSFNFRFLSSSMWLRWVQPFYEYELMQMLAFCEFAGNMPSKTVNSIVYAWLVTIKWRHFCLHNYEVSITTVGLSLCVFSILSRQWYTFLFFEQVSGVLWWSQKSFCLLNWLKFSHVWLDKFLLTILGVFLSSMVTINSCVDLDICNFLSLLLHFFESSFMV